MYRLGFSITGPDAPIVAPYGTRPSYVDLMQKSFNRADEKALLASVSYDFSGLGVDGLSVIMNFVAGFDGTLFGVRGDREEFNLTIDYRVKEGLLKNLWLRVRGSRLDEDIAGSSATDFRVILRYDFTII